MNTSMNIVKVDVILTDANGERFVCSSTNKVMIATILKSNEIRKYDDKRT